MSLPADTAASMRLRKRMNSWWRWRAMHWPITVPSIQRSEQRGRAVPDIIVGHRPGPTFLHRQTRLGAVERLNLRLLVDRQHETVGRRVDIQPDHIAQLGGKGRILRQLEAPYPVRLSVGTGHLAGLIWRDGLSGS